MSCAIWSPVDCAADAIGNVLGDSLKDLFTQLNDIIFEAVGAVVGLMASFWVLIPSPSMDQSGTTEALTLAGASSSDLLHVVGWVKWVALGLAVMSLMGTAAWAAWRSSHGHGGGELLNRTGIILLTVVLISNAGAISVWLNPRQIAGTGPVSWIQANLWVITTIVATLAIIVGAVRIAWTQRGQTGKELMTGVIRFVMITGSGTALINILLVAGDQFSAGILLRSLSCNTGEDVGPCFGRSIMNLVTLTGNPTVAVLLLSVLSGIIFLTSFLQVGLLLARNGLLVILTGTLPLAAAAAMIGESGMSWWKKAYGWLLAFVLYKPTAAIIYAGTFVMVGQKQESTDDLIPLFSGLIMMLISLVAIVALIKFFSPITAAVAGAAAGGGMAMMMAMSSVSELATGATSPGKSGGGSSWGGGGGSSQPTGAQSPTGGAGPSSSGSGSGPSGATPSKGSGNTAPSSSTGPSGSGASGAGSASGAPTGAASSGAAGGASAGGLSAAAGPVGLGVAAGAQVADKAKQATGAYIDGAIGSEEGK